MAQELKISCLCGGRSQQVFLKDDGNRAQGSSDWALCHCDSCRYVTGLLCTSYAPIGVPSSLEGLVSYSPSPGSTRYFCATCGCHLFRSTIRAASDMAVSAQRERDWEVTTGAIVESPGGETDPAASSDSESCFKHLNVADTRDGGISVWVNDSAPNVESGGSSKTADEPKPAPVVAAPDDDGVLNGACHCGTVRFHITRPDDNSKLPKSNFADLITPYCRSDQEAITNPSDTKWWLRDGNTKYLAGTCACRSCRLASGFEIQTWAFVPRSNIYFRTHQHRHPDEETVRQLDFGTLPGGILKSYTSSPGIVREFCTHCGATVFWHDKWRPELIDVSVGLLRAPEGARASTWLDWWTGRVSFAEDTVLQRTGAAAQRAQELIWRLEAGLRDWGRRS
ncbi:Mss4-like protein [Phialemonium atrogriseum]|uniref:Mss4-like protein n=1 Tax=Phialemonium atrogriseum TaxID=1093897 RepID=A0AAJ0C3U6_9PEZI|nr:Mss4-like protein [Phialemonium atrogriseum]KAK1769007.1 Mss4-like protein [Phialemonium atrogriseum]